MECFDMRLMIIGLDGASPFLIQKWIDDLPNIRNLVESGVHGVLESIVPPASVPAWQCFATGKNPAKIGIFGFVYIGRDGKLVKGKTSPNLGCIWDLCSQKGLRVGVLNVPGTYPPYPVNGFMVCGFPVPPGKTWAYPNSLMGKLDSAVNGYEIDVPVTKPSEMKGGERAYLSQVDRLHGKSLSSAKLLIDWFQPDLFMMTFQGLDMVQHDFWRYMDVRGSKFSSIIKDWYGVMDSAIGELRRKAGSDTHVVVMSDHGSLPVSTSFHINEYLRAQSLLVLRDERRVKRRGSGYSKIRKMVLKRFSPDTVNAFYKMVPHFMARRLTASAKIERSLTELVENIDWNRTRVFSTGGVQANIYLSGNSNDASLLKRIRDMLGGLKHPGNGEPLRVVFHSRDDSFSGPFKGEAPDLCIEFFAGEEKIHVSPVLGSGRLWSFEPYLSAEHVREGFWCIAGPGVKKGISLDASILDLAPTFHRLLGLDSPGDLDGRVLTSIFQTEMLEGKNGIFLGAEA
jgi:predicted AlkP superfamily phosphohydrolase/phosphomutase